MLAIMLLSHAGDDVIEVTWPRCDEDIDSCGRHCYRVMLAMTLPRQLVCSVR
jgi:hypothetical protein